MSGYIKLNRKFFDNFLWNEARTYSKAEAWLDLIQSARFEASTEIINGKVIEVQRGEFPASRRFLELRWSWGSTKVSNFLKILSDLGMINQRQVNGQTVLRLVNFEVYNNSQTTNKPQSEPLANQGQTNDKPEANQNKEREEGKEYKELKKEDLESNDSLSTSVDEPKIDYKAVLKFFREQCPGLPKAQSLSDARRKAINARVREYGKESVIQVIRNTGESDFLNGKNNREFLADFDWIMKPKNFAKVLDGNYSNRKGGNNVGNTISKSQQRFNTIAEL